MEVGDSVRIFDTGTFWDGKKGVIERIEDDAVVTVFVDFDGKGNKKIRQDFDIENLEVESEQN